MSVRTKALLSVVAILLLNFIALVTYVLLFLPDRFIRLVEHEFGVRASIEMLVKNPFFHSIIRFEGIVFLVIALISMTIVYFFNVRPLTRLTVMLSHPVGMLPIPRTTRKDELGRLQNSFANLSEQLQEEKHNQDRIISGISHDIKTPLTSIAGYAETLLKKDLGPEQTRQYLGVIFSNAQRIGQIVDEFDLFVEGRQPYALEKREYDASFIREMLQEEYEAELCSRGVGLQLHCACPPGIKLWCDLSRMRRVFANLVGNALKHNQDAQGFVIEIAMELYGQELRFFVRDNGHGAAEGDIPHLFDPFYTSAQDRARHGLGLSICRDIIRAHVGWIEAGNRTQGGFEVRFGIPLRA